MKIAINDFNIQSDDNFYNLIFKYRRVYLIHKIIAPSKDQ